MKIKSLFVGDTDNTFIQFFRYCFVGGFAFVVDFGVMTLLTEVFSVYPVVSSTVSFVAGLLVNYLLSTFWIFKNSKIKNRFAEFLAFALIGVIGLGINAAIIWLFQNPLATGLVFGGESAVVNGETKYGIRQRIYTRGKDESLADAKSYGTSAAENLFYLIRAKNNFVTDREEI